jgi:hypothetical protein
MGVIRSMFALYLEEHAKLSPYCIKEPTKMCFHAKNRTMSQHEKFTTIIIIITIFEQFFRGGGGGGGLGIP